MNINQLSEVVKKKLRNNFSINKIEIEDKSFLHKNHASNDKNKFHIRLIITSDYLKRGRKYAVVLVFLIAAFLTPPDLISQIGLAIPTLLLYEVSIFIVSMIEKRKDND